MKILITGTAGFIGFHLLRRLAATNHSIVGLDNINDYYDTGLKYARLERSGINTNEIQPNRIIQSSVYPNYRFVKMNLEDNELVLQLFNNEKFDLVCHLAAQAGVRYSITNPQAYINSNIHGFLSILEGCRHYHIKHLVFASSSSVYGLNGKMPFSVKHNVDHPVSLYAATKKSNELMAHAYSHLYQLPVTGLRFFTVYGPWGRPDMALFLFTRAILDGKPIDIFNKGDMMRDFTYIDDIVEGLERVLANPPFPNLYWDAELPDPSSSRAPYKVYNIGNHNPVKLLDFIKAIETATGKEAIKNFVAMQQGDVKATYADVKDLIDDFDYKPETPVAEGVKRFVDWFKEYYTIK